VTNDHHLPEYSRFGGVRMFQKVRIPFGGLRVRVGVNPVFTHAH
jgi:hypothetical protein